jgi:hypothetical protein
MLNFHSSQLRFFSCLLVSVDGGLSESALMLVTEIEIQICNHFSNMTMQASNGVDHKALTSALLDNPAGNADEQTPLVLVRSLAVTKGG